MKISFIYDFPCVGVTRFDLLLTCKGRRLGHGEPEIRKRI